MGRRSAAIVAGVALGVVVGCNGGGGGESATDSGSESGSGTPTTSTTATTSEVPTTGESDSESGTAGETEGPVGSCSPNAPIDLMVSDSIAADVTWQGTVRITADIDVYDGATLTIRPGTAIIVDIDKDIEIGWNSQAATILAQGTAEQPIEFCGASAEAGGWRGITVQANVTSDSVLEHVIVRHAGGGQPALTLQTGITVRDLLVTDSGDVGVEAVDFRMGSEALTVEGAAGVPVRVTSQGAITRLPLGGAYVGNGDDVIALDVDEITTDTHYRDPGVPYRQERDLDVFEGAEVTIDPGVQYLFAVDTDIEFGWNSQAATLRIEGTADRPIMFAGATSEPGFWSGLVVQRNVTSDSKIAHTIIRDAGGGASAMSVYAPISLTDVTFEGNLEGLYVDTQGLAASSTNLTITGTMGPPMTVETAAIVSVPIGGDYTGNGDDWIVVLGGDLGVSGTIREPGVPYSVEGAVDVFDGAKLTIEPGVEFVMGPDTDIEFGWNNQETELTAVGTADAPIVFRGRDPAAGWWRGITIQKNVLSSSKLQYVEIGHAGQSDTANLTLRRTLDVTDSRFHDSAGYGILKEAGDLSDYLTPNTFANNAAGDVGDL